MNYLSILRQYFGFSAFRGIQKEIVESIGSGHDTLGLMPTGGGKSITFQVPALAMEGVCLVITPLIALMKDQVQHLRDRGILASVIYSGMSHAEVLQVLDNAVYGGVKFLYVSPERLSSPLFIAKIRQMRICFITVDEAHCISQWGYDFRPSYLHIAEIRNILEPQEDPALPPKYTIPVLALTATATPQVVDDIQERLAFSEKRVVRMSFKRENLIYVVRHTDNKEAELIHILNSVQGSAIVYTRSRQNTKDIAKILSSNGISATFYHAGLDFAMPPGNPVYATGDGVVEMVAFEFYGYGNCLIINHGFGYKTRYAHMKDISVVEGLKVKRGDFLGESGKSGKVTGPHLHYEVIYMGSPVNPMNYMDLDMSPKDFADMVRGRKGENVSSLQPFSLRRRK